MSKKIGIFAGTFDPIHAGHLAFARAALAEGLEKVMFLPEPRPRRKQGVRALEHRAAMVKLAIADEPRFGQIVLEQARFTPHETLPVLQARFAGYRLVLLFGDDVVAHMAQWPQVESLVQAAELLIASRYQHATALKAALRTLQRTTGQSFEYQIIYPAQEQVASSRLRFKLKRRQPAPEVPPPVQAYIRRHKLYSSETSSS